MEIILNINDIELLAKALNNAFLAYQDIISTISLGISPQINSNRFEGLSNLSEEELKKRYEELKNIYFQIEDIERRVLND